MRQTHELKTWPEYYNAVVDGDKTFEVRKDDREYEVGDMLILMKWDPDSATYTGHFTVRRVTYCLRDPQFVKEGFVIMGIKND